MTDPRPVVVQVTPANAGNPYYRLFGDVLRQRGWDYRYQTNLEAIVDLARTQGQDGLVVHFHQFEPLYRGRDHVATRAGAKRLVDAIAAMRLHGAAVVHTMHNRRPHDGLYLELDAFVVRSAGALATRIIVLGELARRHAERITDPARVRVVPHPNFSNYYGPPWPTADARERLAIPRDDAVILSLGGLKPYKGHDLIIESFDRAQLPATRLMIVGGKSPSRDHQRALEASMERLGRVRARLVAVPVPDHLMAAWLGAADVAAFGFPHILMSGSMMLALSYGVPVVVPEFGALPEYVRHGDNGYFYDAGDPETLAFALTRSVADLPANRLAIMDSVAHLAPVKIVEKLETVYQEALAVRLER